jgi:uncharacterized Zn finger protein (UPF0148 family)
MAKCSFCQVEVSRYYVLNGKITCPVCRDKFDIAKEKAIDIHEKRRVVVPIIVKFRSK